MSDVLLIPSAVQVPDELRLDLGQIPTAMIPLHGKPMMYHIVSNYDDISPYIAHEDADNTIESYIEREGFDWRTTPVDDTTSLGDTIAQSLDAILERERFDCSNLYINFADTYVRPTQFEELDNVVSFATESHPVRWTTFEEANGDIRSITEKFTPEIDGQKKVFTGVFKLSDPVSFRSALTRELENSTDLDPFYRALQKYLDNRSYDLIGCKDWIDAGHLDTYHEAKQQFLNVRDFNEVSVDERRSVIEKTSDRTETLAAEFEWYRQMPRALEPYLPQVYDFSESEGTLTLEYVGYPSLRDIHLHGSHGIHIWNQIFDTLFSMLDEFSRFTVKEDIDEALKSMYVHKTTSRLDQIDRSGNLSLFFDDTVEINGVKRPGVPRVLDNLEKQLHRHGILETSTFQVIHGDLCFSNILFDIRTSGVKLIDPRGEFGNHVVHGDQLYDLAKLRHSVAGNYDFIINDLFDVTIEDGIEYEVYTDESHHNRQQLFDNLLAFHHENLTQKVELIESLLFLSMVPLHDDAPVRQQYMLAHGLELFDEVVN